MGARSNSSVDWLSQLGRDSTSRLRADQAGGERGGPSLEDAEAPWLCQGNNSEPAVVSQRCGAGSVGRLFWAPSWDSCEGEAAA